MELKYALLEKKYEKNESNYLRFENVVWKVGEQEWKIHILMK